MTTAPLLFAILTAGAAAGPAAAPVPLPSAEQVAGWLTWHSGIACRQMIDECLDHSGNNLFETPEYKVSNLKCRATPEEKADCSFTSEEYGRTASLQQCTATFKRRRLDSGEQDWEFALRPRESRYRYSFPILTCN